MGEQFDFHRCFADFGEENHDIAEARPFVVTECGSGLDAVLLADCLGDGIRLEEQSAADFLGLGLETREALSGLAQIFDGLAFDELSRYSSGSS